MTQQTAPQQTHSSKPAKSSKSENQLFRLPSSIGVLPPANPDVSARAIDALIGQREPMEFLDLPKAALATAAPLLANDALSGPESFVVGSVVHVPTSRLTEDPLNAREFYTIEDLDEMSQSLSANGQLLPITAYEKEGRLWVFDGVKRLRAARSAGIMALRVDVRSKPDSDLEIYMTSRRMNLERSTQSALDDAVRWQALLEQKIILSQDALAKLISKSEGFVSQVLAINRIPRAVLAQMKEQPKTSELMVAYKVSMIFKPETVLAHGDEALSRMAKEIVNEIADKNLNKLEVDRLIERRLGVPKQRTRSDQQKFRCFGREGLFKTFPGKGKVEFKLSGLTPEQISQLETAFMGLQAQLV